MDPLQKLRELEEAARNLQTAAQEGIKPYANIGSSVAGAAAQIAAGAHGANAIQAAGGQISDTLGKNDMRDIDVSALQNRFHKELYSDPAQTRQPHDFKLQVGRDVKSPRFEDSDTLFGPAKVISNRNAATTAHEMGHAINSGTPEGKIRQSSYLDPNSARGKAKLRQGLATIGGIGVLGIDANPDASPTGSMLSGMVSNLVDPDNINIMKEEADAWKKSKKLTKQAGLKYNPRMAGAAFSTYPSAIAAQGIKAGAVGWLYGQTLDKGLKLARDLVIDPISHALQPELTPVEKSMEKYGYNRDDYRITGDPDTLSNWKVDSRFGKRNK